MSPISLNDTDSLILDHLEDVGRTNTTELVAALDKSRQHIHQRLDVLQAADLVDETHGLYERTTKPRPDTVQREPVATVNVPGTAPPLETRAADERGRPRLGTEWSHTEFYRYSDIEQGVVVLFDTQEWNFDE